MPLSPILEQQTTYPFVRLAEAGRWSRRVACVIDFGTGDPREPTDPLIRQALVDGAAASGWAIPPRRGCRSSARRSPAGSRRFGIALDPDTEVIPTLGSKEAIFCFAHVDVDPAARATPSSSPTRLSGLRARRPLRARPAAGAAAAGGERLPPRSRRDRRRDVGAHRGLLGQLPEQPDRRGGAALLLRASSRSSRASTTSCSRPTRRTPSSGSTSRPPRRSSSPTGRTSSSSTRFRKRSLDDRLPVRIRGRATRRWSLR